MCACVTFKGHEARKHIFEMFTDTLSVAHYYNNDITHFFFLLNIKEKVVNISTLSCFCSIKIIYQETTDHQLESLPIISLPYEETVSFSYMIYTHEYTFIYGAVSEKWIRTTFDLSEHVIQ